MRKIIAEIYPWESRIAIVENDRLAEVFWENQKESVGNIYRGKIRDVIPGLSCVFIDIGLNKNAFLYAGDIRNNDRDKGLNSFDLLKKGQDIMVQVKKEAFSEKGARVTGNISIPGHYIVVLPFQKDISISRKIVDDKRRENLRSIIEREKTDDMGVILRTTCLEGSDEEIIVELKQMQMLWREIKERYKEAKAPFLIFEDIDVLERTLRDYLDHDIEKIIINNERLLAKVESFIAGKNYGAKFDVKYEKGALFEKYNLEKDIRRAINRKVWLKSGGYLVFDETEAMTIIDVNSGKFTGNNNFADTIFRLNCEAALEIPRQLRLRSVGGIILIDFISMKDQQQEHEVINLFKRELEKDKAHTRIIGMTGLGFLEMTRRKSRYGISEFFSDVCHVCNGRGRTLNLFAVTCEIKRKLINLDYLEKEVIICEVNPQIQKIFKQEENFLNYVSENLGKQVIVKANPNFEVNEYELHQNFTY